jgi:hypothetical protein
VASDGDSQGGVDFSFWRNKIYASVFFETLKAILGVGWRGIPRWVGGQTTGEMKVPVSSSLVID